MRLGLLVYAPLETTSGGYLYDRMLVQNLLRAGDEVRTIPVKRQSYVASLTDNIRPSLRSELARLSAEVMLEDELNHPSLFQLNRWLRRTLNCPIVSIVHHLRSSESRARCARSIYSSVEHCYLRSVDGFIVNSKATLRQLRTVHGLKQAAVTAVPGRDHLPADVTGDEIDERALSGPELKVIFVGNIIPRKGLHNLLTSLQSNRGMKYRLLVVGDSGADPRYAASVKRVLRRQPSCQSVEFRGRVSDAELARLLRASHVLALPSSYEGFGIAYLEAMGFGLAVIGSTEGGAGEMITHGREGFLVEPGDTRALTTHLRTLAADRGLLASMGRRARQRYLSHPKWAATTQRVRSFLENTILPGPRLDGQPGGVCPSG